MGSPGKRQIAQRRIEVGLGRSGDAKGDRPTEAQSLALESLRLLFETEPARVLAHFREQGIHCLAELSFYHEIRRRDPWRAREIEVVAQDMGIPIR